MAGPARLGMADALFGKTLQRILGLLFGNPGRGFYLREVVAHVGGGMSQVQTELSRLVAASLVLREKRANQVYFQANAESALFEELRGIAIKTYGVAGPLREALEPVAAKVRVALVFGSTARRESTARSDIDLLVVGGITQLEVAEGLDRAEAILKRPVSMIAMTPEEFRAKRGRNHHFLSSVLSGPKIFVIGDEGSLSELAQPKTGKPRRSRRVAPS